MTLWEHLALAVSMTEKFENRGFTLKTYQLFSFHTTPDEFKKSYNHRPILDFIAWLSWRGHAAVSKMLYVHIHENEMPVFSKFVRLEERFRKAPFL